METQTAQELTLLDNQLTSPGSSSKLYPVPRIDNELASTDKPFIQANTIEVDMNDVKENHIIPVYIRNNEPLISQADFIATTMDVTSEIFHAETILRPSIRVSHPVKGRVPEARNKPASELLEWEKTLYYERLAFLIEIPTIRDTIDGQKLSLVVGGIKAYNLDNLYSKRGSEEHFTVFIGFKVRVCTNLCIWTDGLSSEIRVSNLEQLRLAIYQLVRSFDAITQLKAMETLQSYSLTELQFAQLIGRCKMYQHLPAGLKKEIPELQFGDSQINMVCKDYYKGNSFCRNGDGSISLWKLYNLFTSANKQTYIDSFMDRAVNANSFVLELANGLEQKGSNWFLG